LQIELIGGQWHNLPRFPTLSEQSISCCRYHTCCLQLSRLQIELIDGQWHNLPCRT
jgi:hypothetical protein